MDWLFIAKLTRDTKQLFCWSALFLKSVHKNYMNIPKIFRIFATLLVLTGIAGCGRSPSQAVIDKRAEELLAERQHKEELAAQEAEKIAAERARQAEMQQGEREKVAGDLSSRSEARQAKIAANMERAAAEQARRDSIVAELKGFVDDLWIERPKLNKIQILRINGYNTQPGKIFVSPTAFSVTYLGEDADYFNFQYEEDAFSVKLRKSGGGLSIAEVTPKKPLADGFEVGQTLPDLSSGLATAVAPSFSRGLLVLKATYGADQTQRDVKDLVKSKIQNGRLDFRAHSGELGGDPAFGKVKTFYIKYISNGRTLEKSFREGEHVSLP
jgi:hypothetical protein